MVQVIGFIDKPVGSVGVAKQLDGVPPVRVALPAVVIAISLISTNAFAVPLPL
jgi:hypothetical protein